VSSLEVEKLARSLNMKLVKTSVKENLNVGKVVFCLYTIGWRIFNYCRCRFCQYKSYPRSEFKNKLQSTNISTDSEMRLMIKCN
jgi:hypothetical protein